MTNNQIEYAKYLENQRHNVATEQIQSRDAETKRFEAETGRMSQAEAARHNVVNETLTDFANREAARHNEASEIISVRNAEESERTHQANELLGVRNAEENERRNRVSEYFTSVTLGEAHRHNIAAELIGNAQAGAAYAGAAAAMVSAQAAQENAVTNAKNADTRQQELAWEIEKGNQQLDINQQDADTREMTGKAKVFDSVTKGIGNIISAGSSVIGVLGLAAG